MSRNFQPDVTSRSASLRVLLAVVALAPSAALGQGLLGPQITSLDFTLGGEIEILAEVPPGHRHAVLEVSSSSGAITTWESMVSGPMTGAAGSLRFTIPHQGDRFFARVRIGPDTAVPPATFSGLDFMSPSYSDGGFYMAESSKAVHVLNRLGYGPGPVDFNHFQALGAEAYINEQLAPQTIDESGNDRLNGATGELFHEVLPYGGNALLSAGDGCRFFRGVSEPPGDWADHEFIDNSWETGVTGLGYGDGDDATILDDMPFIDGVQPGYLSVYVRQTFEVADPLAIDNLVLRMKYDDGFVAYINGEEVVRENVTGNPPLFDTSASSSAGNVDDSSRPGEWIINSAKSLLVAGPNTLAVQLHNRSLTSSDASVIPSILDLTTTPYAAIEGVKELQHLVHLRGIYSRRQLLAALGEFWENHFTTDYDKVRDYFEDLDSFESLADIDEDRAQLQARTEAASLEYDEYQFFYENALGNFGDLLLFSATSPTMLIYLDGVLNRATAPNENYAREILELHTYGVSNGYTQFDIEELARCFTGWTIRKVHPGDKQAFPQSALNPPLDPSLAVETDTPIIGAPATWDFFRGTVEPTPGGGGEVTTDWAQPSFDPASAGWESGLSGFGYGDDDDETLLDDMEDNYLSVYARTEFVLGTGTYDVLVLEVDYDDGYVAYLNGSEISRSSSMRNNGTPPAYNEVANNHEAGSPSVIDLTPFLDLLTTDGSPNVLAIQGHNTSLTSSDFSLIPRLLGRSYTAESIAETEAEGIWTFRFDSDEHDTGEKVLFFNSDYEMTIAPGRTGLDGANEAIEVIEALVSNGPTAEFICLKLVNRFVSDEISLDTYKNGTAPEWLLTTMDDAIAAWESTSPQGNIATVMEAILDPAGQVGGFWLEGAKLSKVKNPIEFINSGFRALEAEVIRDDLPDRSEDMGMELFQRDDPDGFSESGADWVDTLGLLERMKFGQALGVDDSFSRSDWDIDAMLAANGISTPEELIGYFDTLLFDGKLKAERWTVLLDFANSDDSGNPSPFDDLGPTQKTERLRGLTGLVLAAPEFQFQ